MHGLLETRTETDGGKVLRVEVRFTVNGAYVCKQVGEQEVQPSEWEQRQAEELAELTPEQIIEAHNKKIAELRAVKVKPSYRCDSAVEG